MPRARVIPDPAGVLPSDEHRRVLGSLCPPHLLGKDNERGNAYYPNNTSAGIFVRVHDDLNVQADSQDEVLEVLHELDDLGLAREGPRGWSMTRRGYETVTGPIANEPPPVEAPARTRARKRR